jgi:hypothetical protein
MRNIKEQTHVLATNFDILKNRSVRFTKLEYLIFIVIR